MCNKLNYTKNYIYMVCIILIIVGGLNWGLVGIFDFNLVQKISYFPMVEKGIYLLVAVAALVLMANRDTYLPFLGETVYPIPLNNLTPVLDNNKTSVVITNLPSNTKVVYWAADPPASDGNAYDSPQDAYNDYSNSGIGTSDDNGTLTVVINNPASYRVGMLRGDLKPHIHYRYWKNNNLLSKVYTQSI